MSTEPQDDATSSSPINHNDRHLYGAIHHMNSDSHSTVMSNSAIEDAPEEVNNKMSYSTKRMAEIRHQIRFETQAIKRWRGILGLGVFLLVALVLVATIVTSNDRKASEDNEQSSYFFFKAVSKSCLSEDHTIVWPASRRGVPRLVSNFVIFVSSFTL